MKNILFTLALLISFSSFGQDDIKQGLVVKYYESGAVFSQSNYVDGKLQGSYIEYYESGVVRAKASFVENKFQGESIEYYENGEIKEIQKYKDGVLIEN